MRRPACSICRTREVREDGLLMCLECFQNTVEQFRQSRATKVRAERAALAVEADAVELPPHELSEPMTAADFLYDVLGYYPATAQGRDS